MWLLVRLDSACKSGLQCAQERWVTLLAFEGCELPTCTSLCCCNVCLHHPHQVLKHSQANLQQGTQHKMQTTHPLQTH